MIAGQREGLERRGRLVAPLVVLLLALVAHGIALGNGFAYDDPSALLDNPSVQGPFDPATWLRTDFWGRRPGTADAVGTWRPLPVASFWLDWQLGRGAPWLFHLTNVLLHAATALLLFATLLHHTGRRRTALIAAGLFAVMAGPSEAVAALVGRADVLATGLSLLAWLLAGSPETPTRPWRLAATSGALLLALASKETALLTPLWILLLDWLLHPPRQAWPRLFSRRTLALLAPGLLYLVLRTALGFPLGAVAAGASNNPLLDAGLLDRLRTGLRLFLLALRQLLLPLNLSPDYSYAEILPERSWLAAEVVAGGAALALVVAASWLLRRRAPLASAAAAWLVVVWLPLSNWLVPLPVAFAERLLYPPAAALALLVGWGVDQLLAQGRRGLAAGLVLVGVGGNLGLTVVAERAWQDDRTLFSAAVSVTPRSARAWTNLGGALAGAGRHPEAVPALQQALRIAPDSAPPHTLLGLSLAELGRPAEAERELRRAWVLDARSVQISFNLALFLARSGREVEAAALLRQLFSHRPREGKAARLLDEITVRLKAARGEGE